MGSCPRRGRAGARAAALGVCGARAGRARPLAAAARTCLGPSPPLPCPPRLAAPRAWVCAPEALGWGCPSSRSAPRLAAPARGGLVRARPGPPGVGPRLDLRGPCRVLPTPQAECMSPKHGPWDGDAFKAGLLRHTGPSIGSPPGPQPTAPRGAPVSTCAPGSLLLLPWGGALGRPGAPGAVSRCLVSAGTRGKPCKGEGREQAVELGAPPVLGAAAP